MNGKYVKALAKFTTSGTHFSDFFSFCDGCLDVAYLRACLAAKPNLNAFVLGGMFQRDHMDSLKRPIAAVTPEYTRQKKWQTDMVKSMNRVTDFIMRKVRQQPATNCR